jgi:probable F420-dependent oxidoreductase
MSARMRFGLRYYATAASVPVAEVAQALEARGFESFFVPEHTHMPLVRRSAWPGSGEPPRVYSELHDPFVALSFAAAATQRLRIGTGICLVVERDPIILAKLIASLDVLSGGRVVVGVGGGWNAEEMADHGTAFEDRWKVLRERIEAMKVIWTTPAPEFHGAFVNFDKCNLDPKPLQRPYPPMLMGGMGGLARQRAVDLGCGWMPIHGREEIFDGIADLHRRADEAGKPRSSVTVWSAEPDAALVDRYVQAGVERVVLTMPVSADRSEVLHRLDVQAEFIRRYQ